MSQLIRLTYVSTTASKPATLRQDLTNILQEARQFNFNHYIHGVLLYGNDCFYQCIEGPKVSIDQLYEKLLNDRRHKQIRLLSYDVIPDISFDAWQMKYVLLDEEIQQFFTSCGVKKFNPYKLQNGLEKDFLCLLLKHHENIAGEHEYITGFLANMYGRIINLKYILLIVCLSTIVILVLYWFTFHIPKAGIAY